MGNGRFDKEQTKPLYWMLVLHGLNEGFIPLYHPAQFPACTSIVALSTGALHWLAHCPAALLCALSPEHNLSPKQHRSAARAWSRNATDSPAQTPGLPNVKILQTQTTGGAHVTAQSDRGVRFWKVFRIIFSPLFSLKLMELEQMSGTRPPAPPGSFRSILLSIFLFFDR